MNCKLVIDGIPFSFGVDGDFFWGEDEVLYNHRNSIISTCSWKEKGYDVADLLDKKEFIALYDGVCLILKSILLEQGIDVPDDFSIKDYHRYVVDDDAHFKVISKTRFLTKDDFNLDFDLLASRISELVNHKLSISNPLLDEEIIILRISRPKSLDINPLHRDAYLDLWENVLNVWIPIEGCDHKSSLPVAPSSHFWNESCVLRTKNKGASINSKPYHVPGIVEHKNGLHLVRPNPKQGQALIFTPYLVHGAAINENEDATRLSLELRLCSLK